MPPPGPFGDFWGFGGFKDLWTFLDMPSDKASMTTFRDQARKVCQMNLKELESFNDKKKKKKRESR